MLKEGQYLDGIQFCFLPVAHHVSPFKESGYVKSVAVTREGLSFPIVANTGFDSAVFFNIQLKRDLETCFTSL